MDTPKEKEYELIDYILLIPKNIIPFLIIFFVFNIYSFYGYYLYLKNRTLISSIEVAPINEINLLPLQLIEDTLYVDSDIFETTMYKTGGTTGTEIILQKVPVDTQNAQPTHKYTSETLLTYFFDELISEVNINHFIKTNNLENLLRYESFDIRYAFSPKQKMREKRFYVILFKLHIPASANRPDLSRKYVEYIHLKANSKILEEIGAQVDLLKEFFLFNEKKAQDKIAFEKKKAQKKLVAEKNDLEELRTIYQNIINYVDSNGITNLQSSLEVLKEQSTIAKYLNIEQPIMISNEYSNMIKDSSQTIENFNKNTKNLLSIIEYGYLAIDKQLEILEERISNKESYANPILDEYSIKLEEVIQKIKILNIKISKNNFYPAGMVDEYKEQYFTLKENNSNSINMISKIISKFNLSEHDFKIVNSEYSKPTTHLERHNFTRIFVTLTVSIFVMILFLLFRVELMRRKNS